MKILKSLLTFIHHKIFSRINHISIYLLCKIEHLVSSNDLIVIKNSKEYEDLILLYNDNLTWNYKKRFEQGSMYFVLIHDDKIVTSGWGIHSKNDFLVEEIDLLVSFDERNLMLYDFYTSVNYRNKGFYTKLLALIVQNTSYNYYFIYALSNNTPSRKGIERSNFKHLGNFSHYADFGILGEHFIRIKKIGLFRNSRKYL